MAFDWGALLKGAITVGSGIYDYIQADDVSDKMYQASTSQQVDPFGAQRPYYQQKMRSVYNDPSQLANLPGYQFAQQQGEKAINRQAAKTGHYISTNRLYDISKFNTGLAEQMYHPEMDRLAKLSGAQFGPNAQAYANLQATGGQGQIDKGSVIGKTAGILTSEDPKSGTSILGDILKGFGINFDDASGGSDPTGGALEGINYQEAIQRIAAGEDPKEVLQDTALDYGKEKGMDWLKSEGADIFSEQTGFDLGQFGLGSTFDAANALGGGAAERAQDLYGLGTNADLGGSEVAGMFGEAAGTGASTAGTTLSGSGAGGVPGTLSESWQGMQNTFDASQLSAGASAAGAAGGLVGSYLGSKIPGLGTDTPLGGYMGGVAGTALGAGAVGGAAAAMAAAGPAAIVGAAIIIGQGIYGVVKGAKERDHQRDEYRRVTGEATHGQPQVDDPTGIGEGKGAMYTSEGHTFFLPEKYYANLKRKNMQGEYGHFTEFGAPQGSYGYWQDPSTQEWHFGSFGGEGIGSHAMDAGSFQFQDRQAAYDKYQTKRDNYMQDRAADQWLSNQRGTLSGEGEIGPDILAQYSNMKSSGPKYTQKQVNVGEGEMQTQWVSNSPTAVDNSP